MSESGHRMLMPEGGGDPPPEIVGLMVLGEDVPDDDPTSPRSWYAERGWLPSLGPTALWAARRIIELSREERYLVDTKRFANAIGVAPRPLCRALDRLVLFRVADWDFDRDPRCPVLMMQGAWAEAPQRGLAAAYQFHPAERNTDGANRKKPR